MHVIKGNPFGEDYFHHGKYDKQSYWIQLDNGREFTPLKKFLLSIPIVLLLITLYAAPQLTLVNIIASAIAIIPKFPFMHGKKILSVKF